MNKIVTSKEAILKACKELVSEGGIPSLNMRAVAERSHVAIGSIYNYFPSKAELAIATIESVWQDIFHLEMPCEGAISFADDVERIFDRVMAGIVAYPNFFIAHSIGFASPSKGQARQTMAKYVAHMKNGLIETLNHDKSVKTDAFNADFTAESFVDFVLTSLMAVLAQSNPSCKVLSEMIKRTIY